MIRPSISPVTLTYGYHSDYPLNNGMHHGTDFAYIPDDKVYMPEDGTVLCVPLNGNDGNAIYIKVDNRFHGLCHLRSFEVPSSSFQVKGTIIGIMGNTGAAIGRHLHHALKLNGEFVNPEDYYNEEHKMNETGKLNKGDIINVYRKFLGHDPNDNDFSYHIDQKGADWNEFIYDLMNQRKDLLQDVYAKQLQEMEAPAPLQPGIYIVK